MSVDINPLALLLLLFVIYRLKSSTKKQLCFYLLAFVSGVAINLLSRLNIPSNTLFGVVYKTSDSYALVRTLSGNYYLDMEGFEVFDIVKLKGQATNLSFSHYQESFDFKGYLNSYGVYKELEVEETSTIIKFPLRPLGFKTWYSLNVDSRVSSIVISFLFGDMKELNENYHNLESTGILSLFRVSGIHISFLFNYIERKLDERVAFKKIARFEFIFITILVFLANYRLALLRILLVRVIRLIFPRLTKLERDSLSAMVFILLVPRVYLQTGFYLIYPLLFLLDFSTLAFKRLEGMKRTLGRLILLYLYFLPYNLATSYVLSPLSFFIRLVLVPVSEVGFLMSILAVLPFGELLTPGLLGIAKVIDIFDNFSFNLVFGKPPFIYIALYYVLILITLYFIEIGYYKYSKAFSLALGLFIILPTIPFEIPKYEVHFIDVSQGDATLIRKGDKNYLIDTGGLRYVDLATESLIPYFTSLRITKLDKVFITHGDYDHYGALDSLLGNFKVGEVLYGKGDEEFKNLNVYRKDGSDLNYDSAVYYFVVQKTKFLVMGDAPSEIESKIMEDNPSLEVDVLKVGHHGSKTSSSYEFLKYYHPSLAIISCGEGNFYGHPHNIVLGYLESLGIPYHRTDLGKTIIYRC